MSRVDVYDIETIINCFTLTACSIYDEKDIKQFVLHESRNDLHALLDYLSDRKMGMIGFNNYRFDYQVIHPLVANPHKYRSWKVKDVIDMLYSRAQEIIECQNRMERRRDAFPIIEQRDVYLIWHFDNKAKHCSLKWVQCAIGWKNVQDMPIKHYEHVTAEEIQMVLDYNLNDTLSTREFYLHKKTQQKIQMRYDMSETFGLHLHNYNDVKIGERVIVHKLAESQGVPDSVIMEMRTSRSSIRIMDCLLDNMISFTSPKFQKVYDTFRSMVITDTRKSKDLSVIYDGLKYVFGFGGLHAAREHQTFVDVDSVDVSSYYPNLSIENDFRPEHLGVHWKVVYKGLYVDRKKHPKGSVINEGYKLALNGAFGKSNSPYSPLYDPKFTMQITINGQMLLAMLCEWVTESGAGRILMANTDGIEVTVYKRELFNELIEKWQHLTKLTLEGAVYKSLHIRDVNNYIALKPDGDTKQKGDFLIDKDFYMDHSMKIVPMAVNAHIKTGIPIREYIENENCITNYLMMKRATTGNLYTRQMIMGELEEYELPKTNRYYISQRGMVMMKSAKKQSKVHSKMYVTMFNNWEESEFSTYGVNKTFYIRKAHELFDATKTPIGLFS